MAETNCIYCKQDFSPLQERYIIRKAIKPKFHPNRHIQIGKACSKCIEVEQKPTYYSFEE